MGIGAYRHLVRFEQPGGVPLAPAVWSCAITSAGAQVGEGLAAFVIRGRYHPGVTLETRILFEGRVLQVQSIDDVDDRRIEMRLGCVEVVGRHGSNTTPN